MHSCVYDTLKSTSNIIAKELMDSHKSIAEIETEIAGITTLKLTLSDCHRELMLGYLSDAIYDVMLHHQLGIKVYLSLRFRDGLRGSLSRSRDTGNLEFDFWQR